jgi:hypothetical protein
VESRNRRFRIISENFPPAYVRELENSQQFLYVRGRKSKEVIEVKEDIEEKEDESINSAI